MAGADLRTQLHVLRHRARWIVLTVLVVIVAVSVVDELRPKQYTAGAQLLVQPASSIAGAVTQQTVSPTEVLTEMQLIASAPVRSLVQKTLGVDSSNQVPRVSTSEVGQTNVIEVLDTSGSPHQAALVANAYANSFVTYERNQAISSQTAAESQLESQISVLNDQIASIESSLQKRPNQTATTSSPQLTALLNQQAVLKEELAQLQVNGAISTGDVQLVSPAVPPAAPSSPKKFRDGIIGLVVGLLLGIGMALLAEHLDDSVYDGEDVDESSGGIPVLAAVPKLNTWREKEQACVVALQDPSSPVAEAYRSLRTAIQFTTHDIDGKTILVTSPSASEGKSSTVANLGVVLAGAERRVVLVGCDLRRPRLGSFFNIDEQPGLTSVLIGELSIEDAIQPIAGLDNLFILPSGEIPPNPAELLSGARAAKVFHRLRDQFDAVVIDSPPLLPVADAVILSEIADSTVVVITSAETSKGELRRASELLIQAKAQNVGVLLNQVARSSRYGYSHRYEYGYSTTA